MERKRENYDRVELKLRPGITGPATLKYRLEDEMISDYVSKRQAAGDPRDAQALTNTTTSTTPSGKTSR